jgi:mediator of RNA polymerase II transcription subunit 14
VLICSASVAKILVEQQLKDRSIPFTEKLPELSGPNAPRSLSAVAGMVATIVVKVEDLLQDGRAAEVAMPLVYLQIKDWWKGGKCQVSLLSRMSGQMLIDSGGHDTSAPASPLYRDQWRIA